MVKFVRRGVERSVGTLVAGERFEHVQNIRRVGTSGGTRFEDGIRTMGRNGTVHGSVTTCYRVHTGLSPFAKR